MPAAVELARREQDQRFRRFYVEGQELRTGRSYSLDGDEGKHVVKVLRCKVGDPIRLADGKGNLVDAEISAIDKSRATVMAVGEVEHNPWDGPNVELVVACGGLKGGRSDWLVEKATELGARRLVPLLTERSSSFGSDKFGSGKSNSDRGEKGSESGGRAARWARVASAALKQSLRDHELAIADAIDMKELIGQIRESSCLSFVAAAGGTNILRALSSVNLSRDRSILLIVGPEGDFTERELHDMLNAGAQIVGLGDNRLRVESAAISLLAATCLYWDGYCTTSSVKPDCT